MRLLALTTLIAVFALAGPAAAQTYTWSGGGGNGNWDTAANWTGGVPASASNTIIQLNNTTQTTTTQNITTPFTLNQLNMLVDATNGFVVNGGQLRFAGSGAQISNAATAALRLNTAIDFSANTTIDMTANNASGREVHLTGPLSAAAGTTVSVTSSNTTPATIALFEGSNNAFRGTLAVTNSTIVQTTGANTLARSATVSTTGTLSTFTVGRLASSGLTATGANAQLGALTGGGQLSLGDNTITSSALVGFNNNALDTVSGNLSVGNAASHLGKVGTGEWRFTGGSSTVTGGFSVRDGLVNFQGSSASAGGFGTASTGAIRVYGGAEVRLTMTGTQNNGRIGTNQATTLTGGTLRLDGSGFGSTADGYSEVAGALNVGAGQSTVRIDTSAVRGARFNFASLSNAGSSTGTVTFLSNNLGTGSFNTLGAGNVAINTAPTAQLVGTSTTYAPNTRDLAILPYGTGGTTTDGFATTFVTYDTATATASIRGLGNENYGVNFDVAANNVTLGGTTVLGSATTANALRMTANGAVNISGTNTLTLTAGALLNNGGGDITGTGTLVFGAAGARTAYITTNGAMTIGTGVSAANLSKNGAGNLTLSGTTTLTGTTGNTVAVNAGTLTLGAGSSVTTSTALSGTNTLTYQVSRGATLDATANGLGVGNFTTLTGRGTVAGTVTVNTGGTINPSALGGPTASLASPGTLAVNGDVVMNGGSNYVWAVNSAITNGNNAVAPTAGTLNDYKSTYTASLLSVSGDLNLNGASSANRVNLRLTSLTLANEFGGLYDLFGDFDPNGVRRSWVLIEAGSITGFSADKFAFDVSAFSGSFGAVDPTRLSVSQVGNSLVLSFTPVPEPGSLLAVCGAVTAGGLLWRRLRRRPAADAATVAA